MHDDFLSRIRAAQKQQELLTLSNQQLSQFQNKHRGQRCVIIGNGPSLNRMDLSFLKNEITFGMNRIYLLFDKWDFTPTYYVSVNPLVIEQSFQEISKIPSPKFLSLNALPSVQKPEEFIFLRSNPQPSFSHDPRHGLWEGHTVTYVAMQLAYFMGFKEVVLIGVDHHFVAPGQPNQEVVSEGHDPNHFHPEYFGKGVRWNLPDLERSEIAYRMAKEAFENEGRRIIDATVDGKLTLFPKVNYREIFFDRSVINNNFRVTGSEGDYDNAVRHFEDALRAGNYARTDVLGYGNFLVRFRKFSKAKEILERYLKASPDDSEANALFQKCQAVLGKVNRLSQAAQKVK